MTQSNLQSRQTEKGFTLVELAIVMIIIGLLIGGILKGQELIANARVSSTVAQIKAVESGISGFRDKFGGLPGDLTSPTTRVPNCASGVCAVAGDGNGQIENAAAGASGVDPGAAIAATYENAAAFPQLGATGFVGGVSNPTNTTVVAGTTNPTLPIAGAWQLGYTDGATGTGVVSLTGLSSGHYMAAITTLGTAAGAANVSLTPIQSANIDRKVDDGAPNTGGVRAIGAGTGATTCASAATSAATYNELLQTTVCGVLAKVQ